MDEEEESVFEIGDFTVVTPLEQFITAIEAALQDWELAANREKHNYKKACLKEVVWSSKSKIIKFHENNQLCMTLYSPIIDEKDLVSVDGGKGHLSQSQLDMTSPQTDFVDKNNIVTMFGVTEYVVCSPVDPHEDNIGTEDVMQYLLSAFRCALLGTECTCPIFLQYMEFDRQLFFGVNLHENIVTDFQSAVLRKAQPQHMNLSGLLALFKGHVKLPSIKDQTEIRVSVKFEFALKDCFEKGIFYEDTACVPFKLDQMALGTLQNPLTGIYLITDWPNHLEDVIIENDICTELDPLNAFEWSVYCHFEPVDGAMCSTLSDLLEVQRSPDRNRTTNDLLGLADNANVSGAFGQLAGSGQSVGSINFGGPAHNITNPGGISPEFHLLPLEETTLQRWVNAIFRFTPTVAAGADEIPSGSDEITDMIRTLSQGNSAPKNGVCSRLSKAFYHLSMNEMHPRRAHIQLWRAFVQELRKKIDRNDDVIDDFDVKEPSLLQCLLQQKLEMLQCCVNAKRIRHRLFDSNSDFGAAATDEFFDAEEDWSGSARKSWEGGGDVAESETKNTEASEKGSVAGSSTSGGAGSLGQFNGLFLVKKPHVPMYDFVTQNASPMTEDMAEQHQAYLEGLSEIDRRRAQLASLISDMQAFKAANPAGEFFDFIRWHSPKDWIETEQNVSERFRLPDNVWRECWEEAAPQPVVNQKRLFNETQTSEEILTWLERSSISVVVDLILPSLFSSAAQHLLERSRDLQSITEIDLVVSTVAIALKTKRRDDYLEALREMRRAEQNIMLYEAVRNHLLNYVNPNLGGLVQAPSMEEVSQFAVSLVSDWKRKRDHAEYNVVSRGVPVVGCNNSPLGDTVRKMILNQAKVNMPKPFRRQYVLRWLASRPSSGSRSCPQRLFASVEEDLFRLAGSFSHDTLFT